MQEKNLNPTTLIGLLSCLAILMITLILLDHRNEGVKQQITNTTITLPEAGTSSHLGTGPTPLTTNVYSDSHPSESTQVGKDRHNSFPEGSASPTSAQGKAHESREKIYDRVLGLIRQNRDEEAIKILQHITANDPGDLQGYALLGDLYYQNDRLSQAIPIWEKILESDPSNEEVRAKLLKAQRERQTHQEFIHQATRHFKIKFEGAENRDLYQTVLDLLEEAYSEVGKALSFYPHHEIIVFLYTSQQFFDVTRAPSWTGGVFDGKIRIPAGGYQDHLDRLRRILFHEYVHAVITQMMESESSRVDEGTRPRVPTWLHEGIAQYLEPNGAQTDVDQPLKNWIKLGGLLELSNLHGSFLGFNHLLAEVAYDESLSAVKFLVDNFGPYSMQRLLTELAHQKTIDEAMRDAIFIPYEEFQTRWENHLKS